MVLFDRCEDLESTGAAWQWRHGVEALIFIFFNTANRSR